MSLRGLRVLVTRPEGRQHDLMAAIEAQQGVALHLPLLAVEDLQSETARQRAATTIMDLDRYQKVLFVSVNAVEKGWQWIDRYWPQLPVGIEWYAVGRATEEALAAHDVVAHTPGEAMDSEGLLALPSMQNLEGQSILIVRGVGGREHLATTMRERGARVDFAECYQRRLPAECEQALQQLWQRESIDLICANSGQTLSHLYEVSASCREEILATPVLVPSPRVAEMAKQYGFATVVQSVNAGVPATLRALQDYRSQQGVA